MIKDWHVGVLLTSTDVLCASLHSLAYIQTFNWTLPRVWLDVGHCSKFWAVNGSQWADINDKKSSEMCSLFCSNYWSSHTGGLAFSRVVNSFGIGRGDQRLLAQVPPLSPDGVSATSKQYHVTSYTCHVSHLTANGGEHDIHRSKRDWTTTGQSPPRVVLLTVSHSDRSHIEQIYVRKLQRAGGQLSL